MDERLSTSVCATSHDEVGCGLHATQTDPDMERQASGARLDEGVIASVIPDGHTTVALDMDFAYAKDVPPRITWPDSIDATAGTIRQVDVLPLLFSR